jgi:hypothetical protein
MKVGLKESYKRFNYLKPKVVGVCRQFVRKLIDNYNKKKGESSYKPDTLVELLLA